jgi:small-conductance mechanosensitive channel
MSDQPVAAPAPATEAPVNSQAQDQTAAPAAKPQRQFIDVDGERVDLDQLKREYKKFKGADQKFREAADLRKEVDSFYEKLLANPEEILNDPRIPLKKRELAEKWLTEQLENELKVVDPRDRELEDYKAKLKAYEEQEAEQRTKQEQEQYMQVVAQRREAIAATLSKAMELSPLSKDPAVAAATLKEMASYMRLCKDAGYQATPEEIAQHVESGKMASFRALADRLEGDDLVSFLGQGVVKKLIAAHLGKIQKAREVPAPDVAESWQPAARSQKREFVDPDSLRRRPK